MNNGGQRELLLALLLTATIAVVILRLIDVIDRNGQPKGIRDESQKAGLVEKIGSAVVGKLVD